MCGLLATGNRARRHVLASSLTDNAPVNPCRMKDGNSKHAGMRHRVEPMVIWWRMFSLKCLAKGHSWKRYGFVTGVATIHLTIDGRYYCTKRDVPCEFVVDACERCGKKKATAFADDGSVNEEDPYRVMQAKGFRLT